MARLFHYLSTCPLHERLCGLHSSEHLRVKTGVAFLDCGTSSMYGSRLLLSSIGVVVNQVFHQAERERKLMWPHNQSLYPTTHKMGGGLRWARWLGRFAPSHRRCRLPSAFWPALPRLAIKRLQRKAVPARKLACTSAADPQHR